MSEELLHEETQNEGTPVTMADLEEHFDDANPWNVVKILHGKRYCPSCKK
mgnify:CR=1 FL=1